MEKVAQTAVCLSVTTYFLSVRAHLLEEFLTIWRPDAFFHTNSNYKQLRTLFNLVQPWNNFSFGSIAQSWNWWTLRRTIHIIFCQSNTALCAMSSSPGSSQVLHEDKREPWPWPPVPPWCPLGPVVSHKLRILPPQQTNFSLQHLAPGLLRALRNLSGSANEWLWGAKSIA